MSDSPAAIRVKERSPGYPGIDLGHAVERAAQLYRLEKRNAAPTSVILSHWGYASPTGPGSIVLASLKKFGFLVDEGTGAARKARLTDDAIAILLRQEEDPVRQEAIRSAALRPKLHAELWNQFSESGLPSDKTLLLDLQRDRRFTESGAKSFIAEFKRTLSFAGLVMGGTIPRSDANTVPEVETGMTSSSPPATPAAVPGFPSVSTAGSNSRAVQIPLGSAWATLQAPFPMTEETWSLMFAVLNAMKPGLVQADSSTTERDDSPTEP
ncbi:MAG: hypothetical protein ACREN1_07850 [Candidatus Dormibacteria bacterium]